MKKIRVLEASIGDNVMKYAIPRILQMVKLCPVSEKAGATEVTHDFNFGRNTR